MYLQIAREAPTVTKDELLAAIKPIRDFLAKKTNLLPSNSVDACLLCVELLSEYVILKERHKGNLKNEMNYYD